MLSRLVEMNPRHGRVWWIAAVMLMLVLALIGVIGWRTRLTADERLEQEAINAAKKNATLQTKGLWRSPGLVTDWINGKADEGQYLTVWIHAETNLLRTGYLGKRKFRFEHRTNSWKAFDDVLNRLQINGMWSCKFLTAESAVEVVARSNAIPIWEALVRDFDQPPARSD
jgi:hypothetical protein